MRTKKIRVEMYRQIVDVCYGGTKDDVIRWAKRSGISKVDRIMNMNMAAGVIHLKGDDGGKSFILWIHPRNKSEVAHEICHLVFYIMDTVHIPHTDDTDEAYAYLQGWLWKKIMG